MHPFRASVTLGGRRARLIGALGLCVTTLSGCTAAPQPTEPVAFPVNGSFDYQLGGAYPPGDGVSLVVRDRNAVPAEGVYSICYINAFQTQPGELDRWPDDVLLTSGGAPVVDPDWPDEVLLDTSTEARREAITRVLSPWIQGCADAGFGGVEFDNLDSFTRSGGALRLEDNLALAVDIARIAHDAGLQVGQKNAAEFSVHLHDAAGFDFAVAEECAAYAECDVYTDVYGDAIVDIEYVDQLPQSFATLCTDPATPRRMILRDRELVTPADEGYVYQACTR